MTGEPGVGETRVRRGGSSEAIEARLAAAAERRKRASCSSWEREGSSAMGEGGGRAGKVKG